MQATTRLEIYAFHAAMAHTQIYLKIQFILMALIQVVSYVILVNTLLSILLFKHRNFLALQHA